MRSSSLPSQDNRTARVAAPSAAAPSAAARSGDRVMMLGLRGIPGVQGGVEKHVEMLAARLAAQGWQVEVVARSPYLPRPGPREWNGVRVTPLWAPRSAALEALLHTFLGVLYAGFRRPDILHIHAIGPSLMVPLARLFSLKVVVTHHGYDYDRQKWGAVARAALRLGERFGMRLSHARIAVSGDIARTMDANHRVAVDFVPNGVAVAPAPASTGILDELRLARRRYVLLAARFVPEKRQSDLIRAFARLGDPGLKLVLAGDAEHESAHAREVRALAAGTPGVVLAGFQTGDRLAALFANAALFVLPSSHEGMPIALLEAMAYGLPVLASDIVANKELKLPQGDYFPLGDVEALAAAMAARLADLPGEAAMARRAGEVGRAYSWTGIAGRTGALYRAVLGKRG